MKQQRWSDGLVFYTSMRGEAPMNAIWDIFCTAGSLYFLGLAEGSPLRGGLDISWGAELHKGELYGPIVANAYELESSVAQYPRIVVGTRVVDYLRVAIQQADESDPIDAINSQLASLCSHMIVTDLDGFHIIDYLGESFTKALFTEETSATLFTQAHSFVSSQFEEFSATKNSKLAIRYKWLLDYFQQRKSLHV